MNHICRQQRTPPGWKRHGRQQNPIHNPPMITLPQLHDSRLPTQSRMQVRQLEYTL